MFRNVFIAVGLFIGIAVLAIYLAQRTEAPIPVVAKPPVAGADSPVVLTPAGDFLPRRSLPSVKLQTDLKSVTLRYYHVQDPALLLRLYRGTAQETLSDIALARLLSETTPPQTTVTQTLKNGALMLDWQSPLPLGAVPGLYVVTVAKDLAGPAQAATWFLRTDLLVTAAEDRQQWQVVCQNLVSGKPVADVALQWFGAGATPLAVESVSGPDGLLSLAKEKLPPNAVPQLLVGDDGQGSLAFVPLRTVRLPIDDSAAARHFLFTDQPHYQDGQTVHVWGFGLGETPETVKVALVRPDGLALAEKPLQGSAGSSVSIVGWQSFTLPSPAMSGRWVLSAKSADGVRHDVAFMVGAPAVPHWQSRLKLLARDGQKLTLALNLQDKSGRTPPDQPVKLTMRWQATRQLPDKAADYAFGGYDTLDEPEQDLAVLVAGPAMTLSVVLPNPPEKPYPLEAHLRLVTAEQPERGDAQPLVVPFAPQPFALGLKALFATEPLRGNSKAAFQIGLFRTAAGDAAQPDLRYELLTERRSYRWFFADGVWDYKSDAATVPVLSGAVRLDDKGRGMVSVPVRRGQYRLDVFTADRKLQSSWRFKVEALTPVPPTGTLSVTASRDEHEGLWVTMPPLPAPSAMLALDDQVRAARANPAAAGGSSALAAALPNGGYVLGWSPQVMAGGLWRLLHGLAWVAPRPALDEHEVTLSPQSALQAGSRVAFAVRVPKAQGKKRMAQLVAIPVAPEQSGMPLLSPLALPRALQVNLAANIPTDWPQDRIEPKQSASPAVGDGSVSAAVNVPDDGRFVLDLDLPPDAARVAVRLLVWDAEKIGESQQILPLLPGVPKPVAAVAIDSSPVLHSTGRWACLPPLTPGQTVSPNLAGASTLVLAPFAVPNIPALVTQLYAAETTRSDVLARSLLAAPAYAAYTALRGVTQGQQLAWQRRIAETLLLRQRGDGGIALTAEGDSDLTASAFALLAWPLFPEDLQQATRENALLDFLQHRLDRAWGAETELYPRSDAFYALSSRSQINPATLRYFVEKYGNTIRHGVFEAELAAALQSIGDKELSSSFAERALAQLPSLRVEQPQTALQILEILTLHDLAPVAELVAKIPDSARLGSATATLAAVTGAQLWPALAQKLPGWQVGFGGQTVAERGLLFRTVEPKLMAKVSGQGTQPTVLCSDHGVPAVPVIQAEPKLHRAFYSLNGQALRGERLMGDGSYVVVLSVPDVSAGPAEFVVPMPSWLKLRAVIPGGQVAGQFAWLKQLDAVAAQRKTPHGLILTLSRPVAGSVRVALLVTVAGKGKASWPAARLAQFNITHEGQAQSLVRE